MKICVYAASSRELDAVYADAAFTLGRELALRGHELVFGGGTSGLMGAVARGVESAGGRMTGVAPRFFDQPGILHPGCSEMLFTETMGERKKLMEDISDAFAVLPGGIGTFEEFFETLTLKQLGLHAKGMALLNTAGYYDPMAAMLQRAVADRFLSPDGLSLFAVYSEPAELLSYLEGYRGVVRELWKEKIL